MNNRRIQASGLEGPIPSNITLLRTLTDFYLMRNMLSGRVPDWMLMVRQAIDLSYNKFNESSGDSCQIRKTNLFASLSTDNIFYLTRNMLSGRVPDWMLMVGQAMRISDLNGPDTLCPTFRNTTYFKNLILRSCNLIGNLPEYLSPSLKVLDLSFNKLNGSIPDSYLNIQYTDYIFITVSDYTSLYINCGGEGLVSFDDKLYEDDADQGGPARFLRTDRRWGFSNTGHFLDNNNRDSYIERSAPGVLVNSSKLYKSARISALSLTYYGLCLNHGSYNVNLHFAEIRFTDDGTYSSLVIKSKAPTGFVNIVSVTSPVESKQRFIYFSTRMLTSSNVLRGEHRSKNGPDRDRFGPKRQTEDRTEMVRSGPGRSSVRSGPTRHNLWVFYKTGPDQTDRTEDRIGPKPQTEDRTEIIQFCPVGPVRSG
uniref:non-specific serine/threonine protein kinase n=1 Tax=Tanacetum cinerariifolium TaxID=118510 RepID=A0A6L2J7U1_TANCI|nr:probable leucine-rich repeat receptor-like serine/threonine-protein kinase At3g14840 [Tanacetum cinerariifolium]